MHPPDFKPGFRLSALDLAILIIGGVGALYASTTDCWLGIAVAFVVLHFFLFCNVLRMSRPLELIWAGVFVTTATLTIVAQLLSWPTDFVISAFVTIVVAVIESRRPSYHGVGWRRVNPGLPDWWRSSPAAR